MSASERKIAELEAKNAELRHLLSQQLRSDDTIWSDGGVNPKGEPFITLRWGNIGGQFTVDEMRQFALVLIETADAAQYDADLIRGGKSIEGWDEQTIAALVQMAGEFRGQPATSSGEAKATPKIIPPEED